MTYWLLVFGVVYGVGVIWMLWTSVRQKPRADLGRVPLTLQRRSMLLHETQRQAGERGEP